MRRTGPVLFLAFLLFGLWLQEASHFYEHLGRPEQGATAPHAGSACAKCELLAAGANGVASQEGTAPLLVPGTSPVPVAFATRPAAFPAAYASRAPPLRS